MCLGLTINCVTAPRYREGMPVLTLSGPLKPRHHHPGYNAALKMTIQTFFRHVVHPAGHPHYTLRALHRLFAVEAGRRRGRKALLDIPPD